VPFAAELLRAYRTAGALAESGPDVIEARVELDLHGAALDEVIQAQLAQLDRVTRDVLAAMAVWGTDIGAGDLARLLPGPDGAVDEPLHRAVSSGLVRREPGGTVRFSHDLFREVTYGELAEPGRRAMHRRAAEVLAADGCRPSLVADHLLRAAGTGGDPALVTALHEAVAATRGYAPEVTADLLDDVAAIGADVPEQLLLGHADALFHRGRGASAETLVRTRIRTVADPAVAAQLQVILIRSLVNRADITTALEVIGRTAAIAGLPAATVRQLEGTQAWLLVQAGQGLPAAGLDAALERAEETGTGWISLPVGLRSYIDAHCGHTGLARERLESFRHRGLSLQFGHDRPGWAELAVLEAEGATCEAGTLARTLWSAARAHPGQWAADLAPDVTRVALAGMDRRLAGQIGDDAPTLCPPDVARLVYGMLDADPDVIEEAACEFAGAGRLTAETFAHEELACAAAAAGNRDRAANALEAALAGYQRMGAIPDRDRALARTRALGIRRSSREAHREVSFGWGSLTATETRIAGLVREGMTNREIGTRLFVSPRTVQTHVSHILQKTGLRSRVEIARSTEA
jgi:DNA-binding CsgD family transcriptional regulator